MKQQITQYAEILDNAARDAEAIAQFSSNHGISLDEAYLIQKESIKRRHARGERPVGLKLGFTSKAKMEQMGVHDLIWGRLTDKMQIDDGGELVLEDFIHPRAEPEIAFLIKKDIKEPVDDSNVSRYISKMTAAIEVIDSRFKDFKFTLEDVVADNCSSAAFALGNWQDFRNDIADLNITLKINDEIVEKGNSSAILGNPVASFIEAARLARQNEVVLKKDMIVLAGAATPAIYLKQGNRVKVEVERLCSVVFNVN